MVWRIEPIDVEDMLRREIMRMVPAVSVSAPPLAQTFQNHLPHVLVTRTGGSRLNMVIDQHAVSVDVRASSWSSAVTAANRIAGMVVSLPDDTEHLTQWRTVQITALPYSNPDPQHPTVPRVSFTALLTCRATLTK